MMSSRHGMARQWVWPMRCHSTMVRPLCNMPAHVGSGSSRWCGGQWESVCMQWGKPAGWGNGGGVD
jgi:hypothetical protein